MAAWATAACGGISDSSDSKPDSDPGANSAPAGAHAEPPEASVSLNQRTGSPVSPFANDPRILREPAPRPRPDLPPRAPEPSAAEHRGHSSDKRISKPPPEARAAAQVVPPAEYRKKQQAYLDQLRATEADRSTLSAQEQAEQRAALKRQILGD